MKAKEIKAGDIILPPERELRLWMRRHVAERGMSEKALHLTVLEVKQGAPDKRGEWLIIKTVHSPEWERDLTVKGAPFRFKARPETEWIIIQQNIKIGSRVSCHDLAETPALDIFISYLQQRRANEI